MRDSASRQTAANPRGQERRKVVLMGAAAPTDGKRVLSAAGSPEGSRSFGKVSPQAKQMNLYQYMQLCEPDNFKPEGPGQFRHKGHSSLTFAEDGSWTYFKTKATGRTALNYLIEVEGVSFVEAVREINRIQGGVRPSFQPVKVPPTPCREETGKGIQAAEAR